MKILYIGVICVPSLTYSSSSAGDQTPSLIHVEIEGKLETIRVVRGAHWVEYLLVLVHEALGTVFGIVWLQVKESTPRPGPGIEVEHVGLVVEALLIYLPT
jgi:hypothetical protein